MIDDTSLEFEIFDDTQQKLCEVFMLEGHSRLDTERARSASCKACATCRDFWSS